MPTDALGSRRDDAGAFPDDRLRALHAGRRPTRDGCRHLRRLLPERHDRRPGVVPAGDRERDPPFALGGGQAPCRPPPTPHPSPTSLPPPGPPPRENRAPPGGPQPP